VRDQAATGNPSTGFAEVGPDEISSAEIGPDGVVRDEIGYPFVYGSGRRYDGLNIGSVKSLR
jgi:hypothetical protein